MSKPNIVIVGHVCIDHNKSEHATYTGWGSSALYMAQVFREAYGSNPQIVTRYGADLLPYLPQQTLLQPTSPDSGATLIYENDSSTGKRVQSCRNIEHSGPPTLTPEATEALQRADIVVVAPLLSNYPAAYVAELLAPTRPDALKVLCPQGYFRAIGTDGRVRPQPFADATAIVPLFDLVFYSEEDIPYALETARTWAANSTRTQIVVTQSASGATAVDAVHSIPVPTTPIAPEDIVDSVGCGDTFAAVATMQYFVAHDAVGAIQTAHLAASQKLRAATGSRH